MALFADNAIAGHRDILRRSDLCRGLGPRELQQIAESLRPAWFASGQVICRQDDHGDRMYFVAKGRVKLAMEAGGAEYRLLEYLGKGNHFGEMAMLTDGRHTATASTVMHTLLLALDQHDFDRLMAAIGSFAANLSRSLGFRVRWHARGKPQRRHPRIVGLVNSTLRTQGLAAPLARALAERGEAVAVLTDRGEAWPAAGEYQIERIPATLHGNQRVAQVQDRLHHLIDHHQRVLLDLTLRGVQAELPSLLSQCEEVWWLIDTAFVDAARQNLATMAAGAPELSRRLHPVWLLKETELLAPPALGDLRLAAPDFKVVLTEGWDYPSRNSRQSLSRLVRHLRGTRLGVALGGGGARGLAHLGVLRGLERAGITFDLVSGTSSGALMGMAYAAGWSPDEAMLEFQQQLTPPRLLRVLPGGLHSYLWMMFRSGGWERKLRPYLGSATLEQLQIPLTTVAVDLVSGQQVVRDRGDVVHAVLESINLPTISRPILRDGMALIDGGVLNNLPADLLPERGAALVVGIDVVSKVRRKFAGNVPGAAPARMRRPGLVETLLRVSEVQDSGLTAQRRGAVDLMISPDTSAFEFADFSQGEGLAEVGEAAAEEAVPQLEQMLADLEANV